MTAAAILDLLTEPLGSPVVARAAAELALLGVVSGVLGSWIVLWRLSYSAESLAHAMLPGLVLAALAGAPLLLGGALGLLVAAIAIAAVGRVPVLDRDVAVAVVISALLGLGVLLGLSPQTPAGLGSLLFGDILGVGPADLLLAAALALVSSCILALLHPSLLAVGFDRAGAAALGRAPAVADVVLVVLLAAATLVAVQALGNLLVVAVLVGPAATARVLTRRLPAMMAVATGVAVAAALAGLYASYYARIAAGAAVTAAIVLAYFGALAAQAARGARRPPAEARS